MGSPSLDVRIDTLYALPFGDFVAGRKALMDDLRRAGDSDGARLVKGLAKPTFAAWLTNQAVRREPELVPQLLAATQELAAAQRAVARTGDTHQRFQDARAEQRRLIERLMEAARAVVAAGVRPADPSATLEKVERNLTWGPLSRDDLAAFQQGRLLVDVAPPGFAALAGDDMRAATSPPKPAPKSTAPDRPAAQAKSGSASHNDHKKQQARLAAEQRQAQRERAEQERFEEQRAIAARAALQRAQADTARARQVLERSERLLSQERVNVDKATRALDQARAALGAAETTCRDARAEFDARQSAQEEAEAKVNARP